MTIKPVKDFSRLEKVFKAEFGSLPKAENSTIFGAFEDGRLIGFILAEDVVMIGQIYVVPEKRNESMSIVNSLVQTVKNEYDGKDNVGAVASEPRFEEMFKSLGMGKINGVFYRKNIS